MIAQHRKCGAPILFLIGIILIAGVSSSAQQPEVIQGPVEQFVIIDVPGATSTSPATINNLGQIVGGYSDSHGVGHGFLLSAGVYTTIDFPGAASTVAAGINNNGQIVGSYQDNNKLNHGFLLNNGVFTTFDDPAFPGGTFGVEISDPGLIVGFGIDAQSVVHGFSLSNHVFTTFDFPGSNFSEPLDVNYNGSEIVGAYGLPSFPAQTSQGFTFINGVFTSVTFPGSTSTALNGVNNGGEVVGTYVLPQESNSHVFLMNGNTFTNEDVPGAASTGAADLNDVGEIVGGFVDDSNVTHAYLETNGPFAYVADIDGNAVSMIDVTTSLPVAGIPVGSGPWGVAISPDGTQAYVTNNHSNNVSVIDTASNSVTATIAVQSLPFGVAFTPDGSSVYVVNGFSNNVSVISTDSQTVVATVAVQGNPVGVAMASTPTGTLAYVTNSTSNTVSVIAVGAEPAVVQTIPVGAGPRWVAVSPDSSLAYVANAGGNSVSVISVASGTVIATIPVGTSPFGIAFSPDGTLAYVANSASDTVSVIDTASGKVINTVTGFSNPIHIALSTDGSTAYVTNLNANTVSLLNTATGTIIAAVPAGSAPIGIAIAAAPPFQQQITQPLSPTQPNVFNFGTNNFTVQYPAGTNFSNVNMTVAAVEITPATFRQRVAGTQFANATCIVYSGAGGNCVDYQVTCSNTSGTPITCPSEPQPTIAVQTGFVTTQNIVNPGFLTTPIGQNNWQNIFTGFSDPLMKGRTKGFSEFVAVDLGATNSQGLGSFSFLAPLRATDARSFGAGVVIPATFQLTSIANPGHSVTDALASLTLEMVSDATGKAQSKVVLAVTNAFHFQTGTGYVSQINTAGFAPGTYVLTVYGNAFAAQHVQFTIGTRVATTCVIRSSSPLFSKGKPLTLTTFVQPASRSSNTPTGSITFFDSGFSHFALGTAPVVGGKASVKAALQAPPDRQWIDAVYPGDNNFLPCTSPYIPEDSASQ